jgi:hypothetical protein
MPITVEWGNAEQTIIVIRYEGRWDVKDVHAGLDKVFDMLGTVDHTVDSIVDMSQSKSSPTNLLAAAGRVERKAPNTGRTVIVNVNTYLKAIADIARYVAPKTVGRTYFVKSLEEAYQVLSVNEKS